MIYEEQVVRVLLFFVALTASYEVLLFFLRCRLEVFRQRLFSTRNTLFDVAATGVIPFNHPAYRITRKRINALIRYAHHLNSLHIILSWLAFRYDEDMMQMVENSEEKLLNACKDLPQPARDVFQQTHAEIRDIVNAHLPLLRVLLWIFRPNNRRQADVVGNRGVRAVMYETDVLFESEREASSHSGDLVRA